MSKLENFFNSKRVLLTGHTGFKGSWMTLFLHELGAIIQGYALDPKNSEDLFLKAQISNCVNDFRGDVLDIVQLRSVVDSFRPEIVFHFAAQPLVIESYKSPRYTWEVNVMGTLNLLECLRNSETVKSIVIITTDKVYKNSQNDYGFKEDDKLGGFDPYSSSKAAVEILVDSYKQSFFIDKSIGISTARSGNVIGGGDWSENRLIPDYYRALFNKTPFELRNPTAVRPWQHVLDVLHGYLILAMRLHNDSLLFSQEWNFGPINGAVTTYELINKLNSINKLDLIINKDAKTLMHEAEVIRLDSSKSKNLLDWRNLLGLDNSLNLLDSIYLNYYSLDLQNLIKKQIKDYLNSSMGIN